MFTVHVMERAVHESTPTEVMRVVVDGEDVRIWDPDGVFDPDVPVLAYEAFGRTTKRRVTHAEDPVVWAWNLPLLLRGPYLWAERSKDAQPPEPRP
ncbi:hypothetical protein [uncultured Micrococcus sp.]|uniref:hypothetical protein n=1 Tax=uncultured Micrococcus sp. TaxID=114051 RepID=UPI002599AC24|nr:hypothetical protein [uncultured Micrococcus sp.]